MRTTHRQCRPSIQDILLLQSHVRHGKVRQADQNHSLHTPRSKDLLGTCNMQVDSWDRVSQLTALRLVLPRRAQTLDGCTAFRPWRATDPKSGDVACSVLVRPVQLRLRCESKQPVWLFRMVVDIVSPYNIEEIFHRNAAAVIWSLRAVLGLEFSFFFSSWFTRDVVFLYTRMHEAKREKKGGG